MEFSLISGISAIYELPGHRLTVIVEDADIAFCENVLVQWKKKLKKEKFQLPLFLTEEFLERSLDSFPVEILEIQKQGQLIAGENIAEKYAVSSEHLRLQLEREFRGKALRIRQALLEKAVKPKELLAIIHNGMLPFYNALYYLYHQNYPQNEKQLHSGINEIYPEATFLFSALEQTKITTDTIIDYQKIIEKLSQIIDTFEEEK